jgi:hypothetical protein
MNIELLKTADCHYAPFLSDHLVERAIITLLKSKKGHQDAAGTRFLAWAAWVADIKTNGVMVPVQFYREDGSIYISDGRNRHDGAVEAGLDVIPGEEITKEQALARVLPLLAHKKHTPQSAKAYAALLQYPELSTGKAGRKVENKSPGDQGIKSPNDQGIATLAALSQVVGVSLATMEDAAKTMRHLSTRLLERDKMEPLILAGVVGLGAAKAGAASSEKTAGKPRPDPSYDTALTGGKSFWHTLRCIHAWPEDDWHHMEDEVTQRLADLPEAAKTKAAEIFQKAVARVLAGESPSQSALSKEGGAE